MHDVGKPRTRRFVGDGTVTFHHHDVVGAKLTRKRMRALRFSNDVTDAVAKLVELHLRFHGYGEGEWTDSAVRRYVRDAGDQLERLHVLTRADCTTRNQRKAERLRRTYDDLEERIARLSEEEQLAAIRPDLDGNQIMEILGIGAGPEVGEAYRFLLELRLEHGPQSPEQAQGRAARLVVGPVLRPRRCARFAASPTDGEPMSEYEPLLEESIDVAAPPAKVWSLVTDLPRMSKWSPQVVRTIVRGGPVQLGTRAFNINRRGPLVWPTRTKVVAFEPHREFAFRVKDNKTIWSFTLEPTETRHAGHSATARPGRDLRHLDQAHEDRPRRPGDLHPGAAGRDAADPDAGQGRVGGIGRSGAVKRSPAPWAGDRPPTHGVSGGRGSGGSPCRCCPPGRSPSASPAAARAF